MNISELFIRRPVMTTLVMLGILLFGIAGLPHAAGERSAERGLPDHQRGGAAARRESRDHGFGRGDAARAPVLDHRRSRQDDVVERAGRSPTSRCSSPSRRASTRPRRMCSPPSRRPRACCRPDMPTPPSYQKVNPADQPILYMSLNSPTLAAVDGGRVRRHDGGAAHFDRQRRGAGAGIRLAEVRRARAVGSAARWPRAASASMKWSARSSNANVTMPMGTMYGAHQAFTLQATGQLYAGRAVSAT